LPLPGRSGGRGRSSPACTSRERRRVGVAGVARKACGRLKGLRFWMAFIRLSKRLIAAADMPAIPMAASASFAPLIFSIRRPAAMKSLRRSVQSAMSMTADRHSRDNETQHLSAARRCGDQLCALQIIHHAFVSATLPLQMGLDSPKEPDAHLAVIACERDNAIEDCCGEAGRGSSRPAHASSDRSLPSFHTCVTEGALPACACAATTRVSSTFH
jgi:hypothetical protein